MKKSTLITAICAICTQAHSQSWNLNGNAGTNASTNFIGTTDAKALKFRTNNAVRMTMTTGGKIGIGTSSPVFKMDVKGGSINTDSVYRIGGNTVLSIDDSLNNLFVGNSSGIANTSGNTNISIGLQALYNNSTGYSNTAIGVNSLVSNYSGYYNTAIGQASLYSNTTGFNNTAIGLNSLIYNSSGFSNTAIGVAALYSNTTGTYQTAIGYSALLSNTTGYWNTATGYRALYSNTTGNSNVAIGMDALFNTTTAIGNTAIGKGAFWYHTTGNYNTAIGHQSGINNGTTPSNFTALGFSAGYVGSNLNTVEIGNTWISWIGGQVGWSTYSDRRIKENIQSNVPGLEFITKLNPVTYKLNVHRENEICGIVDSNEWEGKYDIEKITQTGFLAQEVEQAAQECNYDFNGVQAPTGNAKLYSIQYASFVMPLVKAVQEQQEIIEEMKTENEMIIAVLSEEQQQRLKALREGKSPRREDVEGRVFQNAPNPFNSQTEVKFQLPSSFSSAQLIITDANGRQMRKDDLIQSSSVIIKASELSAGTYSYSLFIDGVNVDTKQMILTK